MTQNFFDEPLEQSKVKGQIVADYFPVWAKIILSNDESIGFVDLYAGPGKYTDGTDSTPLLILRKAVQMPEFAKSLRCIFNDKNEEKVKSLCKNINELQGINKLTSFPTLLNSEVSDDILSFLGEISQIPTFYFLDPWGYKGLSLGLIKSAIKSWGSECIFFFNYNRIQAAINNPQVQNLMVALFGKDRLEELRTKLVDLDSTEKELEIINTLSEALKDFGGKFSLPFCFKHAEQDRTSHYLIFVGKHPKGYSLIKEIMAKYSQKDADGIPSFTYEPKKNVQLEFTFNRPLKELANTLLKEFSMKSIEFKNLYKEHILKTRFIRKNYQDVLNMLEEQGRITMDKPRSQRIRAGKLTLGDKRIINFS